MHPMEMVLAYQRDNCIPMFMVALFTAAKIWNQSRYPSTDEWIKKIWYICTVKYYSVMERMICYHFQQNSGNMRSLFK
jgi:hypothetical protein